MKDGTVKAGTVKAGTMKEGTVKGTAKGEKWMLMEPNIDAGVGLEIDARMEAKRVCSALLVCLRKPQYTYSR